MPTAPLVQFVISCMTTAAIQSRLHWNLPSGELGNGACEASLPDPSETDPRDLDDGLLQYLSSIANFRLSQRFKIYTIHL